MLRLSFGRPEFTRQNIYSRQPTWLALLIDANSRHGIGVSVSDDGTCTSGIVWSPQNSGMLLPCSVRRVSVVESRSPILYSFFLQLMEAHESSLRALSLTADGTKLATASNKGTLIRVWDVASATCLHEFRRGVERVSITCLAWSWDANWLACSSDKGTTHIFCAAAEVDKTDASSSKEPASYTQMFLAGVRKSVEGDSKKSAYQVRGLPHPQACAFVADASNILAVAGWDADGNGVLLMVEFNAELTSTAASQGYAAGTSHDSEPRRIGYHVLCRSNITREETEEARRRRRLRGWTPEIPETPEGGRLYVGERLEVLERGMETIHFEETDEFVSVTAIQPTEPKEPIEKKQEVEKEKAEGTVTAPSSPGPAVESSENQDIPSPTSIKTESLDDEFAEAEENHI